MFPLHKMSKRKVRPMLDLDDEDARSNRTAPSMAPRAEQAVEDVGKRKIVQVITNEYRNVDTVTSKAMLDRILTNIAFKSIGGIENDEIGGNMREPPQN